jgi:hypothetical protein
VFEASGKTSKGLGRLSKPKKQSLRSSVLFHIQPAIQCSAGGESPHEVISNEEWLVRKKGNTPRIDQVSCEVIGDIWNTRRQIRLPVRNRLRSGVSRREQKSE